MIVLVGEGEVPARKVVLGCFADEFLGRFAKGFREFLVYPEKRPVGRLQVNIDGRVFENGIKPNGLGIELIWFCVHALLISGQIQERR